jgi:hypothetical protein
MGDGTRHQPAIVVLVLAVLVILGGLPAIAAAPQPVLPVSFFDEPSGSEPPVEDGSPSSNCPGGSAVAQAGGAHLAFSPGLSGDRAAYPGPVIPVKSDVQRAGPVKPPSSGCLTDVSLTLVVTSPNDRKPEGADGSLDELSIPRSALESGFDVSLPAQSRIVTLSKPGEDWELVSTSCTCGGATAAAGTPTLHAPGAIAAGSGIVSSAGLGQRATQPGPVIPVDSVPGLRNSGGGCVGPSATVPSTSAATPVLGMAQLGELAIYPGPVIPDGSVPGLPASDETLQPATVSWDRSGTVNIEDPEGSGGVFACRWEVELVKGKFEVKTVTKPAGREGRFKYLVTPTGANAAKASPRTMSGVSPSNKASLRKGPWSVELTNLGDRWKVTDSSCSESDSTTTSVASGASATLGVEPDDKVQCTFKLKLRAPREGRWRAINGAGSIDCGPVAFDLPKRTEFVDLKVRQDGDRLIGRGLTSGDTTWTLNRGPDESLRYTGSKQMTQAGAKGKFTTKLDLIDEEHMKGTLTGSVKVRGQTCKFKRPLNVSYAGGG